jgi:phosphohistidine phosphatase SixA
VGLLLVRHASAGSRVAWDGDDRERPLDARGVVQARNLVELLKRFEIDAIYTSPYRRCAETVEPLAAARMLGIELKEELGEEEQYRAAAAFVRSVAEQNAVVCGHGGLEVLVVDDPPKWRKGDVLVLDGELRVVEVIRQP